MCYYLKHETLNKLVATDVVGKHRHKFLVETWKQIPGGNGNYRFDSE